jgi:signal transduction histidine kinase
VGLAATVLRREQPPSGVVELTSARPLSPNNAAPVSLPHFQGIATDDEISESRYQLDIPPALSRAQPLAIYLPKFASNVSMYIHNRLLATTRLKQHPWETHVQEPFLAFLPDTLQEGNETFVVGISSPKGVTQVLGKIWVGPIPELSRAYDRRLFLQQTAVYGLVAIYVFASAFAFLFWMADRAYLSPLWFAWFSLFLVPVIVIGILTVIPPISWPLYHHFASLSIAFAAVSLAQFVLEKVGSRRRWTDLILFAFLAAAVVLLPLMFEDKLPSRYALIIDIGCLVIGLGVVILLARACFVLRDQLSFVLLGGCLLTMALGLHSVLLGWHPEFFMDFYSAAYAPVPLMLAMGWVIIRRYARIRLRTEAMNRRLARKVERREREIAAAYQRLNDLERDRTVRAERDRFMRDMHDGLGTQLITSKRMAERNALSGREMGDILQECLDELRLSIESMKPSGEDLFATLANFRYRIEPRLDAAGLALYWKIESTDRLRLDPSRVLQVMRIVNEALSNVLKHSGSNVVRVAGRVDGDRYLISIADEGRGFDPASVTNGEGLASMQARAETIGAEFVAESTDNGTTVTLSMPLPL